MKTVSIILPIFNGEKYIENLVNLIKKQNINYSLEIVSPVSPSSDKSLEMAMKFCDIAYEEKSFNHAQTRHNAAQKSSGEILVFITQDVTPYDKNWLALLIDPLVSSNDIIATYSRQIAYPNASERERLIREFNYPNYNRLCNLENKEKWGRKNIFYSDSASATKRKEFFELGGYNFKVGTNEDVIYALNVISSGKSILYNSESKVLHSHNFEFMSAYKRYKLIGEFERTYKKELSEYSSMGEGKKLLFTLLKELFKKGKVIDIFVLFFDLATRYLGYRVGYTFSRNK